MSNMAIYILGTLLLIAGLAYGAYAMGVGTTWIIVGALVILGIGLMSGITSTRRPEKSDNPPQ